MESIRTKIKESCIDWFASALVIIALLLCSLSTNAQKIAMSPTVEKSVVGLHYGWALNCQLGKAVQVGGFYQSMINELDGELKQDKVYYGLSTSLAFAKTDRITVSLTSRFGFINKNFLLVVPGCNTDIRVSDRLHMLVGSAFRMGAPTFTAGLSYYLVN